MAASSSACWLDFQAKDLFVENVQHVCTGKKLLVTLIKMNYTVCLIQEVSNVYNPVAAIQYLRSCTCRIMWLHVILSSVFLCQADPITSWVIPKHSWYLSWKIGRVEPSIFRRKCFPSMPSLAVIGWGLPLLYAWLNVQHSLWWHFHIKCSGLGRILMSEEWVKIQGLEIVRFKPAVSFYLLVLVHLFFFPISFWISDSLISFILF